MKNINEYTEASFYTYLYFIIYAIRKGVIDILKPLKKPVSDKIQINSQEVKIWTIGHASVLINFYGITILTDPVFVNWLPFPRRIVAAGFKAKDLPYINYVVLSHGHYDHFNIRSLKQIASKADTVIVPKNCINLIRKISFKNKFELGWEESKLFNDLEIYSFKPVHIGKRLPWEKVDRGYNSYLFKRNGKSIFFSGDSGYGGFYKHVASEHKVNLDLLGIGAYKPYGFLRHYHMNPEDALQAFRDLEAEHFIPIHWGNFRLGLESMEEPVEMLASLIRDSDLKNKVHMLCNGKSFKLP